MDAEIVEKIAQQTNSVLVDNSDIVACIDHFISSGHKHLLQSESPLLPFELDFAEAFSQNPFMIESFEKSPHLPKLISCEIIEFNHPDEKTSVIGEFTRRVKANEALKNFFMELLMVADELILNALYEGPNIDPMSKAEYLVDYPDARNNELILCDFENAVGIFMRDPFGSLQIKNLLNSLKNFAENGFDPTKVSADNRMGMGLARAMSHFPALVISVDPTKTSMVGFLMPKGVRKKHMSEIPKSFHIF